MRKLVTPQRDMVHAMMSGVSPVHGMTVGDRTVRPDLYDHLIRISDMVDSYRDLLSGSLEAYMSMVSNRLNDVMKQLTIIATVFLPLSFLTGFFGQNLGWLVTSHRVADRVPRLRHRHRGRWPWSACRPVPAAGWMARGAEPQAYATSRSPGSPRAPCATARGANLASGKLGADGKGRS
jgi:hypothetical protein